MAAVNSAGRCAYCLQSLTGDAVVAFQRLWHPEHFLCVQCKQPIQQFYKEINAQPYCAMCSQDAADLTCKGCNQLLSGRQLVAQHKNWHMNCFICTTCHHSLAEEDFYVIDNLPYDLECHWKKRLQNDLADNQIQRKDTVKCEKPNLGDFEERSDSEPINALDLCQWLKQVDKCDKEGVLSLDRSSVRVGEGSCGPVYQMTSQMDQQPLLTVKAKLRENMLGLWNCEATEPTERHEPPYVGVVIVDQLDVKPIAPTPTLPHGFEINFPDKKSTRFSAFSEEERQSWISVLTKAARHSSKLKEANKEYKLSHLKVEERPRDAMENQKLSGTELFTHKIERHFCFSVESADVAQNKMMILNFEEWMCESKLSLIVPLRVLQLYKSWCKDIIRELKQTLPNLDSTWSSLRSLHLRQLKQNLKHYKRAAKFLEEKSRKNESFLKQSIQKDQKEMMFVPTNLHLQRLYIIQNGNQKCWNFLTSGSYSANALRYENGGCTSIESALHFKLKDFDDFNFWDSREKLQKVKRLLNKCVETVESWSTNIPPSKIIEKVVSRCKQAICYLKHVRLGTAGITQTTETLSQMCTKPSEKDLASKDQACMNSPVTADEQIAKMESEIEKMSNEVSMVLSQNSDLFLTNGEVQSVAKNVAGSVHELLDTVEELATTFLKVKHFQLLQILSPANDSLQLYYDLQIRQDLVLSQALAAVTTGLSAHLWRSGEKDQTLASVFSKGWGSRGPLFTVCSFLSCAGNEKSMMEDMRKAWIQLGSCCHFQLRRTKDNEGIKIQGYRTNLLIILPVSSAIYRQLPDELKNGKKFRILPIYWNVGINNEARKAASQGEPSLQKEINCQALSQLQEHVRSLGTSQETDFTRLQFDLRCENFQNEFTNETCCHRKVSIINEEVTEETRFHQRVVREIGEIAAMTRHLHGILLFCCKSGKDRTAMGVTLEEGRVLREQFSLTDDQQKEIVSELRRNGVRRENCRKNIGIPQFAFTRHQNKHLPEEYRAPKGTIGFFQT